MTENWVPVIPYEYRKGDLIEYHSPDCGWRPYPAQYRWINLDPTIEGCYYCSGTTKYYKQQKQVSYDNGVTWRNVIPAEYQMGVVYQYQSSDCGYVPTIYRWVNMDINTDWICDEC